MSPRHWEMPGWPADLLNGPRSVRLACGDRSYRVFIRRLGVPDHTIGGQGADSDIGVAVQVVREEPQT